MEEAYKQIWSNWKQRPVILLYLFACLLEKASSSEPLSFLRVLCKIQSFHFSLVCLSLVFSVVNMLQDLYKECVKIRECSLNCNLCSTFAYQISCPIVLPTFLTCKGFLFSKEKMAMRGAYFSIEKAVICKQHTFDVTDAGIEVIYMAQEQQWA